MIDKLLNNYKKNEAKIEMLKLRINEWEEILKMEMQDIDRIYTKKAENLGIQKSHNLNPMETMYIRVEEQKTKINSWIIDTKEKINKMAKENKMIDIMLQSLDEESRFIIIQKHFEKKKWNIITYQFNAKYRNEYKEYITVAGIRKKYTGSKKQLLSLFENISQHF